MDLITIQPMQENEIDAVAHVHQAAFPRQEHSKEWITCNFRAFPRIQYFTAKSQGKIVGYIEWMQKSGFRKEAVLELEQIAVHPDLQGRGIGRKLIEESLPLVEQQLAKQGANIKGFLVTTRTDNAAQRLYHKTLGVEVQATIKDLYSADEVVMVGRKKRGIL